jgi:hypothetical protein
MDRVQYMAPVESFPESGSVLAIVDEADIQFPHGFSGHQVDQVIHMVMSVIVADVDRDGVDDLLLPQLNERHPFAYQKGLSDGGFVDVTSSRVISGETRQIQGLIPWDVNNDGWLDLLAIPIYPSFLPSGYSYGFLVPPPDYTLWLNDGRGNFLETRSIPSSTFAPNAAVLVDINGDHRAELWVSNDIAANGSGDSITSVTSVAGPEFGFLQKDLLAEDWGRWGMGMDATFPYPGAPLRAYHTSIGPSVLHVQEAADGRFLPVARGFRSDGVFDRSAYRNKWSPIFADLDLDGDSDLLVGAHGVGAAGHGMPDALAQGLLVHEAVDSENYVLAPTSQGYLESKLIRALEPVDLDADGRLDFIAWAHGRDPIVLMNEVEPQGHWISVELNPTASAHNATGAEVRVTCGDKTWRRLLKDCTVTQACFRGWVHVGLGDCSEAVDVEVDWPSGVQQSEKGLAVDGHYVVEEAAEQASPGPALSSPVVWLEPREAPAGVSGFVRIMYADVTNSTPGFSIEGATVQDQPIGLDGNMAEVPVVFGEVGEEVRVQVLSGEDVVFDEIVAEVSEACRLEAFRVSSVEKDPSDSTDDGLDVEYVFAGGACPGFPDFEQSPPIITTAEGEVLDPLVEYGQRYTRIRFIDPPQSAITLDLGGLGQGEHVLALHLDPFPDQGAEELPEIDLEASLFLALSFLNADGMDVIPMALTLRLKGDKVLTDLSARELTLSCEGGIEQVWPEVFHIPAAGINRLFVRAGSEPGLFLCSVLWKGQDTGVSTSVRVAPAGTPEDILEEQSEMILFAVGDNNMAVAFLPRAETENLVGTGHALSLDMIAGQLLEPLSYRGRGWYGAVIKGGPEDTPVAFDLLHNGVATSFPRSGVWTSEGEFVPGEVEPDPDTGAGPDGHEPAPDCACSFSSRHETSGFAVLALFFVALALYRKRYA